MKNFMNKRFKLSKNQKGMTLIELMAVVVILGILAAVAGVAVTKGFDNSRQKSDIASKKIIQDAAQRYYMENPTATAITVGALVSGGYLTATPTPQASGSEFTITLSSGVVTVAAQ